MTSLESASPHARHLILAGGGHSHALILRMLGMNPMAGVRLTLVSDVSHAPYSGMLPGHIAGFYTWDETHIDLRKLCQFAGANFVHGKIAGIDPLRHQLHVADRSPLSYDLISLNLGSTPEMESIPGAKDFATPAKPVPAFLAKWEAVVAGAAPRNAPQPRIIIVGGGAGGVELALCMHQRLGKMAQITLIHRGHQILDTHNTRVRNILTAEILSRGIRVLTGSAVTEVTKTSVRCDNGETFAADHVFWVTNATAPSWIRESGLATDQGGFVLVDATLTSVSHNDLFAVGDIATIQDDERPKSGVFAVRMARPLLENLRRHLHGEALEKFHPQQNFLSLIGTADGSAVASRKRLAWKSPLMWKWKDQIDRKFMRKFANFPAMQKKPEPTSPPSADPTLLTSVLSDLQSRSRMRCLGCAAKVGGSILTKVMERLRGEFPDVLDSGPPDHGIATGLREPDDAAVFSVPAGMQFVQTVDYMPALVGDPHLFGRIAALHCFSDIFAMGAKPHSLLAALLVPFQSDSLAAEILYQTLAGICEELKTMGALLLGGHTAEAAPPAAALTCNGLARPEALMRKSGLKPGQSLILTKRLGVGTLFAAEMRLRCKGRWIDGALESMLQSNKAAAEIFQEHGASGCTDVTGFGLAGHLMEMLDASRVGAVVRWDTIPLLEGAMEAVQAGIVSSLQRQNQMVLSRMQGTHDLARNPVLSLLFDPQTSGGLLAGVPSERGAECVAALQKAGCRFTSIIGTVEAPSDPLTPLRLG